MITSKRNYDLTSHNTFRMKAKCDEWIEYDSRDDIPALAGMTAGRRVMHIGGGSNLLFVRDFDGVVLHSLIHDVSWNDCGDTVRVRAGSGVALDDLIAESVRRGLWGLENLSAIPGEVGASAVQNVGAYGVEAGDVIETVGCYDTAERRFVTVPASQCEFAYRHSIFKRPDVKGRYIVADVTFRLSRVPDPKLDYGRLGEHLVRGGVSPDDVRKAVIAVRSAKLPSVTEYGSAGSFFKNPVISREVYEAISGDKAVPHYPAEGGVKIPAAWLIEQCGWKGYEQNGVAVWDRQPLIIVNKSGEASAADVLDVESRIVASVAGRFGIELHPEVEHIF